MINIKPHSWMIWGTDHTRWFSPARKALDLRSRAFHGRRKSTRAIRCLRSFTRAVLLARLDRRSQGAYAMLRVLSGGLSCVRACVRPSVRKLLACQRSSAFKTYPILFIFHTHMYDHKISAKFDNGRDRTKTAANRGHFIKKTKIALEPYRLS